MYNAKDYAKMWEIIVRKYKERDDNDTPRDLIENLVSTYDQALVKETFVVIAEIKKHDARIYGENRKWTDNLSTKIDPTATEWNRNNPMMSTELDYIHPAHINQLITQLRSLTN